MAVAAAPTGVPEVGQAVWVRNRLATVRAVDPYDSGQIQGRLHLVEVEYLDDCRFPERDQLLWEVEATAKVQGKTSLPSVDMYRPDRPVALQAFVNAHRWTRLNRLRATEGIEDEPLLGVWNSAIQVHPYQLEPVLRALQMPRVSLLLADGVGLGKTIQACLVMEELLLRRRIRRILIVCPAMLQRQWKIEIRRKFNLDFEVIDSDSTFQLRRRLGIDTNPWKAFPRIITSMDYLRMPDVLQQFLQASGADELAANGKIGPHAAWDLLIVDEAHHFAPQGGSRVTQRTRMLQEIRFLFEHRIFASATPHNGKTVCFTGLLELLDPIRFQMTTEMDEKDHEHLAEVRVRRLKETINQQSLRPPFADQLPPVELPIELSSPEANLFVALREYRKHGQAQLANESSASARWLGQFIFSLLTKRLLSCPFAFARTWWRHLEEEPDGVEAGGLFDMARVTAERAEEQTRSDEERSLLEGDAARYAGAWFRTRQDNVNGLQKKINQALDALGYGRKVAEDDGKLPVLARKADSKTEALVAWVKKNLFDKHGKLRDDERLIVFTEYKETLLYLEQRFRQEGFDENTLRLLYGGMSGDEFESVKGQFEEKTAAVRLLLATDAASEGINMQDECRWIIHFDIPWSPSRIQQRNGRVSRHGQLRDVSVHYFRCDQDEDMEFLFYVARKVEQVREDLGSVERVFDAAIQRHFQGKPTTEKQLSFWIEQERGRSSTKNDLSENTVTQMEDWNKRANDLLASTDTRLGISPEALVEILRTAIGIEGNGTLEEITGKPGFFRLKPPSRWKGLADQTLTVGTKLDRVELVFDAALVTRHRLLKLAKHQVLMRLGHPIMRQAMATLCRQLHDPAGQDRAVYRWSIATLHKSNFEALLIFHHLVTAINDLREPLHDEVRSVVFRVEGDRLTPVEPAFQETVLRSDLRPMKSPERRDEWVPILRGKWFQHRSRLEDFLAEQEIALRAVLQRHADAAREREGEAATESYRYRLRELQQRGRQNDLKKLASVLVKQKAEAEQPVLFEEYKVDAQLQVREIEAQIAVLQRDMERTRELLSKERDHRLKVLLPRRFQLRDVRVLPLALEYVVPAAAEDLKP